MSINPAYGYQSVPVMGSSSGFATNGNKENSKKVPNDSNFTATGAKLT